MVDKQFDRKIIGNNICIFLEVNKASDVLNWFNAFAQFIFMSLSEEASLILFVPQYVSKVYWKANLNHLFWSGIKEF